MAIVQEILPDSIRKSINKWRFEHFQKNKPFKGSSIACFDYYECIFVHIPKTGGISVGDALFGNAAGVHKTVKDYRRIFSDTTYSRYFKFAIVRNPWDRLVSAYFFLKAGGKHNQDKKWAAKNIQQYTSFSDFVLQWLTIENIQKGIHFMPQHEFVFFNNKLDIDFVGKLENIENDFERISNKLGFKNVVLPHKNKSSREHYSTYYTEETKAIVSEVYAKDIARFNYQFENKAS